MDRRDVMLAALAAAGKSAIFEPVQVQKLFFLIDKEIPKLVGGPHFDFQPYDYGPFDSDVYTELERMHRDGLVAITYGYYRSYALTQAGFERGTQRLEQLPKKAREYVEGASNWVRSLSFNQLVTAIYEDYPEMRENSVFKKTQ